MWPSNFLGGATEGSATKILAPHHLVIGGTVGLQQVQVPVPIDVRTSRLDEGVRGMDLGELTEVRPPEILEPTDLAQVTGPYEDVLITIPIDVHAAD